MLYPVTIPESIAKDYASEGANYPSDDINPKLKDDPKFFWRVGSSLLSEHFNNNTYGGIYGKQSHFFEMRQHARGRVDFQKYIPLLSPNTNDQDVNDRGQRESYMNISWEPTNLTSKFINVLKGYMDEIDYTADVQAIDPRSRLSKKAEREYYKLTLDPEWKDFEETMKEAGVKTNKAVEAKDENQVNLWYEAGGLKLGTEIALKEAILKIYKESRFESIKDDIVEDLLAFGAAVAKDELEPRTHKIKARYVDPINFVASYSKDKEGRNIDKAGEIRYMEMGELRKYVDDHKAVAIAEKYMNHYGYANHYDRQGIYELNHDHKRGNLHKGEWSLDHMKVPVFDFEFISTDLERYTKVYNKRDNSLVYNQVDFDYELSKNGKKDGKEVEDKFIEYRYSGMMVLGIGADDDDECGMLTYGKDEMIHRKGEDGYKEAILPFHIYDTGTQSMVEKISTFEDQVNIATYKIRNAIAKMPPPPNIAVDTTAVQEVNIGGTTFKTNQVWDVYEQTGRLHVSSIDDHGQPTVSAQSSPIRQLGTENSIYNTFKALWDDINYNVSQIREITGVNNVADASSPDPNQSVGNAEMAMDAAQNAIKTHIKGYKSIYERLTESIIERIRLAADTEEFEVVYSGLGERNIETLKIGKDVAQSKFSFSVVAMPDKEQKQALKQQVQDQKYARMKAGAGGIEADDALKINRTIDNGNIELAELLMAIAVQKTRDADQQQQMQAQKMNAQEERNTKKFSTQMDMKSQLFNSKLTMQEQANQSKLNKGEKILQTELDAKLKKLEDELEDK